MIENKLTFAELADIIRPVLQLESLSAIMAKVEDVFRISCREPGDAVCQKKLLVTYEGYRIDIRDLRVIDGKGVAASIQFKAKQKWWHPFRDQNARVVRDLQRICTVAMHGLAFERFEATVPRAAFLGEDEGRIVVYYDSRAFNERWRIAGDISPLLIAPDAHHGNCFVEFQFNPGGYQRSDGATLLRDDWEGSACDISSAVRREAKRRLGIE